MRYLFVSFFLLLITGCNKKSAPVITDRTATPPKISTDIYAPAGTVTPDTAMGKTLFTARCGRCHALPQPAQFNAAHWEVTLASMIPRSRIDKTNAVHVREYILVNAAK